MAGVGSPVAHRARVGAAMEVGNGRNHEHIVALAQIGGDHLRQVSQVAPVELPREGERRVTLGGEAAQLHRVARVGGCVAKREGNNNWRNYQPQFQFLTSTNDF